MRRWIISVRLAEAWRGSRAVTIEVWVVVVTSRDGMRSRRATIFAGSRWRYARRWSHTRYEGTRGCCLAEGQLRGQQLVQKRSLGVEPGHTTAASELSQSGYPGPATSPSDHLESFRAIARLVDRARIVESTATIGAQRTPA